MNKLVTQERSSASAVALSQSGSGSFLKPESLGDVVRFAELMCQSKAGIPAYLHGNAADCMAVTLQALQWEFNPFSVAQKSYKIKDVIAYEAQLIAAVINTRADLKRRPQIAYEGTGAKRKCIVTFEFKDGSVQVYESPEFEKITPKNSPLWKSDPDQQQAYYSLRAGARRYCPEVILGAYDRDEVEEFRGPDRARDITPSVIADPLSDDPLPVFDPEDHSDMHDALTGEIIDNTNSATADQSPSGQSPDNDEDAPTSSQEDGGDSQSPTGSSPSSTSTELTDADRSQFMECAAKLFAITVQNDLDGPAKRGVLSTAKDQWKDVIRTELHPKLASIFLSADAIITGKNKDRAGAIREVAGWLECAPEELGG